MYLKLQRRSIHSALLVLAAELIEAITDSIANTEATEQPVIRVATVMVDSSTVAFVVIAVLAGGSRCTLRAVRLRRAHAGRHLDGAG